MKHQVLIVLGLIGVGAVLGATLVTSNDSSSSQENPSAQQIKTEPLKSSNPISDNNKFTDNFSESGDLNQAVVELQEKLQQEIELRKKLELKVAALEKDLKQNLTSNSSLTTDSDSEDNQTAQNPHQSGAGGQGFAGQSYDWFNEQAMLDAGVDPVKVNFIKDSFEQAEMDKLYLRNQAKREGWLDSKRYTDAAKEIADRTDALRNELTENEYDAYLFAAGRANRVMVSSVLSSSPAGNAGIQAGDTILRYGNKRVYNWSDLTNATSEGTPNETVIVTIERDGQTQQVYIPRGPLGVRLATDSVAP